MFILMIAITQLMLIVNPPISAVTELAQKLTYTSFGSTISEYCIKTHGSTNAIIKCFETYHQITSPTVDFLHDTLVRSGRKTVCATCR